MNTSPQPTNPERRRSHRVARAALALASVVGVGGAVEAAVGSLTSKEAPKPLSEVSYTGSPALRAQLGNINGALTPVGDERGTAATTTTIEVETSAVAPSSTEITLPAVAPQTTEQASDGHVADQQVTADVQNTASTVLGEFVEDPPYAMAPDTTSTVASEAPAEPVVQATGLPPVPGDALVQEPGNAEVSQIDPPIPTIPELAASAPAPLAPEQAASAAPAPPSSHI